MKRTSHFTSPCEVCGRNLSWSSPAAWAGITLPLAEEGARSGFSVVGLDSETTMLKQARDKARRDIGGRVRKRLKLVRGRHAQVA